MTYRNLALLLLDDEYGINRQAWKLLADLLEDNGDNDVIDAVQEKGGRYCLRHQQALELAAVVKD